MNILITTLGALIGAAFGTWVGSFFSEKGKNLATKQDIYEITKKIESVKAAVGTQQYVHQTRYQNEFRILEELSGLLVELRESALALRPKLDHINPNETEEDRKNNRLKQYSESLQPFTSFAEKHKPFYPDEIYNEINSLIDISYKEAVEFRLFTPEQAGFHKYWDNAQQNSQKIASQSNMVIQLIRDRIKKWEDFK